MTIKVLIAEDDPDLGNLPRQYLTLNGLVALLAFNGQEARRLLCTEKLI